MSTRYITDERDAGLVIATTGQVTTVVVDPTESAAVHRAAAALAEDLTRVCTATTSLSAHLEGQRRVVVGTLGTSSLVDGAVADGRLDVSGLTLADGSLRWEGFVIQVVDDVLYLVGADRRGTVYAVYDLCEAMGVSPWWWFADVPVRTRDHVTVQRGAFVTDWPSVRYRGIFLNDEEELDTWARTHTDDDTIGPQTYERVFELLLRLKGNYIWPAMHVNAFNHDPANGRLAQEMGIVVGTSHCDMLLRSNEKEFEPWLAQQGEPVSYDYSLPGRNREKLLDYWRKSVAQNVGYEVTWTVGMRGIHDYGFTTAAIDEDDSLSAADKHAAKVRLLGEVINDQRGLLTEVLGTGAHECPQIFIPYKEVLPLYDSGLDVPEDVTIVWANDNFGYVRRFPTGPELERSGGHGLYYHSSYWSQPPRNYLATSSTPLSLMKHELGKSWQHGIRRLWVNNVGGLKPLELETEFFLRYAWQVGKETTTADVTGFVEQWIDRSFSGGHGKRAAQIFDLYSQLNQQRKIEHLTELAFPQTGYGDEAGRRLDTLRRVYEETNEILQSLPGDERDAFFQLFAVRTHMAYLVNAQFVHADRSLLAYDQGKAPAADHHLEISRTFEDQWRALLHFYNHTMSEGRWEHIFTPDAFPPPVMALHPAARPALKIGAPGLGVVAWGEHRPSLLPRLEFWPHGQSTKWIEVFTTGRSGLPYTVRAEEWIEVSDPDGVIDHERRLLVRVDAEQHRGKGGTIVVSTPQGDEIRVRVRVHEAAPPRPGFAGTMEADGYAAFDVARPDATYATSTASWVVRPQLGRTAGGAIEMCGHVPASATYDGPALEYAVHLASPGAHLLQIDRLPTLDSMGAIRVGVSVDDQPPVIVSAPTTDEYLGAWTAAVVDNVERLRLRLPYLDPGEHILRLHGVDEHVTLTGLTVFTDEPQVTNLGPPLSRHTARPATDISDPDPLDAPASALAAIAHDVYQVVPAALPPRPLVYAGQGFWDSDTTFKPNTTIAQEELGAPRYRAPVGAEKDLLAQISDGTHVEEQGVLAIETESALSESVHAWTTPSLDTPAARWTHVQAETNGRTGLAMRVAPRGLVWDDPHQAPGLHYRFLVSTSARYHVWLLVKFDDRTDDGCYLALDGAPRPLSEQPSAGDLYSFGTQQIWFWTLLQDLDLTAGEHTLSLLARKSGLRIDRIYLTTGDELPPTDSTWQPSAAHQ